MKQNKMLAMILAGGRGTRLLDLTKKNAKPAVYFGGKYRIIDFPLSNCANSNINVVGVLTQYESVILNSYAAAGQRWGLDTRDSGVYVLPPREKTARHLMSTVVRQMRSLRTSILSTPMIRSMYWFSPVTIFTRWIIPRCFRTISPAMRMRRSPFCRYR